MTELYIITDIEFFEDKTTSHTRLSDYKPDPIQTEDYKLDSKEAIYEEVTSRL